MFADSFYYRRVGIDCHFLRESFGSFVAREAGQYVYHLMDIQFRSPFYRSLRRTDGATDSPVRHPPPAMNILVIAGGGGGRGGGTSPLRGSVLIHPVRRPTQRL